MSHDCYDDADLRAILSGVKTIAVVGASPNPSRPSFGVAAYLAAHGFEVYPVNPGQAGQIIAGRRAYARLADIPVPVDLVDIFRASAHVPDVLAEVLSLSPRPKVFWMQIGVRHEAAAAEAEAAGLRVVMNRCTKIEYARLCASAA